jgi:hypothetical protein
MAKVHRGPPLEIRASGTEPSFEPPPARAPKDTSRSRNGGQLPEPFDLEFREPNSFFHDLRTEIQPARESRAQIPRQRCKHLRLGLPPLKTNPAPERTRKATKVARPALRSTKHLHPKVSEQANTWRGAKDSIDHNDLNASDPKALGASDSTESRILRSGAGQPSSPEIRQRIWSRRTVNASESEGPSSLPLV